MYYLRYCRTPYTNLLGEASFLLDNSVYNYGGTAYTSFFVDWDQDYGSYYIKSTGDSSKPYTWDGFRCMMPSSTFETTKKYLNYSIWYKTESNFQTDHPAWLFFVRHQVYTNEDGWIYATVRDVPLTGITSGAIDWTRAKNVVEMPTSINGHTVLKHRLEMTNSPRSHWGVSWRSMPMVTAQDTNIFYDYCFAPVVKGDLFTTNNLDTWSSNKVSFDKNGKITFKEYFSFPKEWTGFKRNYLEQSRLRTSLGLFNPNQNVTVSFVNDYTRVVSNQSSSTPGIIKFGFSSYLPKTGKYTVSMTVKGLGGLTKIRAWCCGGQNVADISTSSYTRVSLPITIDNSNDFFLIGFSNTAVGQGFEVRDVMLEMGHETSEYNRAPEDVGVGIDKKAANFRFSITNEGNLVGPEVYILPMGDKYK